MNVGQLKELLESVEDHQEVRLATQQSYPLAYHLLGVFNGATYYVEGCPDHERPECEECEFVHGYESDRVEPILWLVEGSQTDRPYDVPRVVWEDCERVY